MINGLLNIDNNKERISSNQYNVSRVIRSLGMANEILYLTMKLQRNRDFQTYEMPKFWLAFVSCTAFC